MRCLILFFLISIVFACSDADKVKCDSMPNNCENLCTCDQLANECNIPCIACIIAATNNDCCDCLFPKWSGYTNSNTTKYIRHLSTKFQNGTVLHVSAKGEICITRECMGSTGGICCQPGHPAICTCNRAYVHCVCG